MIFKLSILLFIGLFKISEFFSQSNSIETETIYIKGGKYKIGNKKGNSDENHEVKISISDFFIGKFEVSNTEYCRFLNSHKISEDTIHSYINLQDSTNERSSKIYFKGERFYVDTGFENYPVNFVSWFGANAFCHYYNFRLPTEAEWEYAAKKKNKNLLFKYHSYAGSNFPDKVAWFKENSEMNVHQVGLKQAEKKGIYDLTGNVDEWCSDWYSDNYYANILKKNPQGPPDGLIKVYRGGSWYNSLDFIKVTNRRACRPETKKSTIGFRVAKDIETFCTVK
jgi:formylglycine-generating enzyme required for sulfatase activity